MCSGSAGKRLHVGPHVQVHVVLGCSRVLPAVCTVSWKSRGARLLWGCGQLSWPLPGAVGAESLKCSGKLALEDPASPPCSLSKGTRPPFLGGCWCPLRRAGGHCPPGWPLWLCLLGMGSGHVVWAGSLDCELGGRAAQGSQCLPSWGAGPPSGTGRRGWAARVAGRGRPIAGGPGA